MPILMTSCYLTTEEGEVWPASQKKIRGELNIAEFGFWCSSDMSVPPYSLLQWVPGSLFTLHRLQLSETWSLVGTVHPLLLATSFHVQLAHNKGQKLNETTRSQTHDSPNRTASQMSHLRGGKGIEPQKVLGKSYPISGFPVAPEGQGAHLLNCPGLCEHKSLEATPFTEWDPQGQESPVHYRSCCSNTSQKNNCLRHQNPF